MFFLEILRGKIGARRARINPLAQAQRPLCWRTLSSYMYVRGVYILLGSAKPKALV